jgi:hypothetical protein
VDLRTVYGSSLTAVYGINDDGWMVGQAGADYRLLSDGNMVSIQTLLADPRLTVSGAYALNNSRQILATVKGTDNVVSFVLLTPRAGP